MKKFPWKQIAVIAFLGVGVFIIVEIYKAWKAGTTALGDLIMAPWNALKAGWSTASSAIGSAASSVTSGVSAAASLPSLTQTELQNAQAQGGTAASYQPGGTMYNIILATQGQAAADKAAAAAASNAAMEQQQAQADSSWWGFGNLYQYL
jgi:hypothetical protein